jgi:hypothetical protein
MRILLIGHACSPERGSEPAVTWNFAWHLARAHQVWVVTHPKFRLEVERFLAQQPNPNLRFVWLQLNPAWDPVEVVRKRSGVASSLPDLAAQGPARSDAPAPRSPVRLSPSRQLGHHQRPALVVENARSFCLGTDWRRSKRRRPRLAVISRGTGTRRICGPMRVKVAGHRPALRAAVRRSALLLSVNAATTSALEAAGADERPAFPFLWRARKSVGPGHSESQSMRTRNN